MDTGTTNRPLVRESATDRGVPLVNPRRPVHRHRRKDELFALISMVCVFGSGVGIWMLTRLLSDADGRVVRGSRGSVAAVAAAPAANKATSSSSTAVATPRVGMSDPPSTDFSFASASGVAPQSNPQSNPQPTPQPTELSREVANWVARQTNDETLFDSKIAPSDDQTLDQLVHEGWIRHGVSPAGICSDEVFLRRVYFDLLGTLPTVEEARAFLDDKSDRKRSALIDQLLERPEFADYAAMKWSDILRVKAEFPVNLWPNAAQAYHRWIRASIRANLPFDAFARELLTSSGSNFRSPPVNFYRAVQSKEPKGIAQGVALTFLGERTERWPAERLEGMSKFFLQVGYKPTGEWKEEIVYFDRRKGKENGSTSPIEAVFPNGQAVTIPHGRDPRQVFADWLIDPQNPWFARVVCNRVWNWLMGRGIVDPPDDIRHDNPASNPALLKYLAQELVAANYDMKHLYRLILNSSTYQLACFPKTSDPHAAEVFAFYPARRLEAEVLIDAICQITETTEVYFSIIPEPFTFLPDKQRAVCLPDGSITTSFLEMFGRPPRDTGLDSERNNRLSSAQALHLLNSNHLRNKLKSGPGMKKLIGDAGSGTETAERLYLGILSRRPTENERSIVETPCSSDAGARDVAWALINSDEFLFRH